MVYDALEWHLVDLEPKIWSDDDEKICLSRAVLLLLQGLE
jgi:hypothetical protein